VMASSKGVEIRHGIDMRGPPMVTLSWSSADRVATDPAIAAEKESAGRRSRAA
jgi:hypothetical protein